MANVERKFEALLARRQQEDKTKTTQDRIADQITRFAGSMSFAGLHYSCSGSGSCSTADVSAPRDRSYFCHTGYVCIGGGNFLSTFVLITQNRMAAQADRRADLDLQVSLLAEHE